MTDEAFKRANKIFKKIEDIEKLKKMICSNPFIKEKYESTDYMYLSWVDNDNRDLENTIIQWCNNEINRLREEFKSL